MSDLNKTTLTLLNKLFHDEQLECTNLLSALEIAAESETLASEDVQESLSVISAALHARKQVSELASADYYKLRNTLESLEAGCPPVCQKCMRAHYQNESCPRI